MHKKSILCRIFTYCSETHKEGREILLTMAMLLATFLVEL